MRTSFTELLGLKLPVAQAPMGGGVAGPALVTAACRAGALGMLPVWAMSPDQAMAAIDEVSKGARGLPFAVNLNVAFDPSLHLGLALERSVPVIHFFWGDPAAHVARAKSKGAKVMATVGSAE